MKKTSFISWFIRLVRRDMEEYKEDEKEKQKVYDSIKNQEKKG